MNQTQTTTEHRKIQVNGIEMHVQLAGEGPPVLLIHGFPDTHEVWRKQVPALVQAGYSVIVPDTRGCGETAMPSRVADYHLDQLTADMVGLLDALNIERVYLIGHDWGALQAWHLAIHHPERVKRLVVLSVGHPTSYARGGLLQKLKGWYVLLFQLRGIAEWCCTMGNWFVLRMFTNMPDEFPHWKKALGRPGRLTAGINYYRANIGYFLRPWPLPRVKVPVHGIYSSGDRYLTEGQMRGSSAYADAGFRYHRVEGLHHWMQLQAPDTINTLLLNSLRQDPL